MRRHLPPRHDRAVAFALAGAAALASAPLTACPIYMAGKDLPAALAGARADLRLFALVTEAGRRHWQVLPMQVDPLSAEGGLTPPPENGSALSAQPVGKDDRLTLSSGGFGAAVTTSDGQPCQATSGLEVSLPSAPEQRAYLVRCAPGPGQPALLPCPIQHNPERRLIQTPTFEYQYHPNNQLLYERLRVKDLAGTPVLAAEGGEIHMHLDIRSFFTMDFTNKDIESYVSQTSRGPVGLIASIDFYLRLLFFKIDLKMATTVGFYDDSAHIPMLIDVPVDAPSRLYPASGMLYTWVRRNATLDQSHPEKTMPNADASLITAGGVNLAAVGLRYCHGAMCTFRLRGGVGGRAFGLAMLVPRRMVEHGFFPQFVADPAALKKSLGWEDEPEKVPNQVAVYFENAGLPKGQYHTDQWIQVGTDAEVAAGCPRPVHIGHVVAFAGVRSQL